MMGRKKKKDGYSIFLGFGKEIEAKQDVARAYEAVSAESAQKKVTEILDEIVRLEEERNELLDEMLHDFQLLNDKTKRLILVMRYVNGMSWDQMQGRLGYSTRHLRRLWNEALEEIAAKKNLSANVR